MKWIIVIISLVACIVALDFSIKDRKGELEHMEYLRKLDLLDSKIYKLKLDINSFDYSLLKHIEGRRRFRRLYYDVEFLRKEKSLLISDYFKVAHPDNIGDRRCSYHRDSN